MSISIYRHVCFIEGATRSAESYGVYLLAPPISLPTTVPPQKHIKLPSWILKYCP